MYKRWTFFDLSAMIATLASGRRTAKIFMKEETYPMRRTGKKLLAICLTVLLIIGLLPTAAFAVGIGQGKANEPAEILSGYIPMTFHGGRALTERYLSGADETNGTRATLPSSYDSRNYGYITSVKNQNPYGTCWAFGTMASVEAYMIKHGIINNDTGSAATTSMDLSESHLAWFNYTNAYDKLGMLSGDTSSPVLSAANASSYLDMGGNGAMATYTLMRWEGPASENTSALKYSNVSTSGLNSQYAYNYNVAHVDSVEWIPVSNKQAIKEAIMEYGAGTISYYHSDSYYNSSTGAYCFKQSASYGSNNYQYGNHAVTVVGWDDNYSKSNFKSSYGPSSNGAWIIKNSWGSSWGKSGYFYLSYEDSASLNDSVYFYKMSNVDNYANCYQYDGTTNLTSYQSMNNNCQVANIFTANGSETLKAVAISPWDEATSYTLSIYKNPTSATNPSSGTLMTSQTGTMPYAGYYTIELNNPVALSAGDKFAVVFTLSTPSADPDDGKYVHIPYDATASISWCKWTHANHGNTSFYKEANGSWTDVPNNGDFRIKAYTDDASYTVTAVSNNTSYGTVSVNGNKITATPKAGYYVSDAQVTSGTATVSINGNVITVNASSDCTVKVIFAVKPQYTVTYKALGATVGSNTAYIQDVITLPTTATAVNGYEFAGWTAATVAETTNKPSYYAPGASYTVTANATLNALYTRTEGSTEKIYEIVADPLSDWSGNYVITSGKDTSLIAFKGVSSDQRLENSTCGASVAYASTGMTLDGTVLKNVPANYVFTIAKNGSTYTIKSPTNYWIGTQSTYLHNMQSYQSSYSDWNIEYDTYNICMKISNVGSTQYTYLVVGSNKYFVVNTGYTTNKTQLWKQTTASTVYYNTNPSAQTHTHTAAAAVQENVVAPTCTAAGSYDEVVYCATCGEEMSRSHKTVAALGHNPGASVQENYVAPTATTDGGYDTVVYCTRCNAELSREHTTLPATGVTTYYTVSFSVPSGVTAPASQTVASGSSITLPTASAPAGYTFLGWVTATVNNSTTLPTVLTGSYKPTANVTLKAIYSYTEGTGAVAYQLVTSTPSNWAGNYVITNGNSTSMYVLTGVTPSSNGAEIENSSNATAYASTGMSLSNNALTNVADAYVFTLDATGSYYTVKSAATGTYMGMNSSSYLAGYTSYNSSYCRWTPAVNSSGAAQLKNYANGSYPYFGFNTSSKYFWSASTNNANVLRLWKQTAGGTTYYTTEIGSSTPTTNYTVSFSVPSGVTAPASQTVAANSYITLPTAAAPAGYTFLGWVTSAVNNATTQPSNILTGSYKVTGNITLRALYSYTSGGSGTGYQLLTSAPSDWAGNYVITNGNSTSMYVLTGVTPSSNGAEIENSSNAATYASTGMSLSNNVLSNVGNAYVFTLEANGSYYTVKSASTGAYMGMNSSSYLAGYTSYNSSYCRWTPAVNSSGAAQLKNYANGSYPYFGFNTSSKYFWSASTNNANVLRLWKQTTTGSGTTYYTT